MAVLDASAIVAPAQEVGNPQRDAHRLLTGFAWVGVLGLLMFGIALAVPDMHEVIRRVAHATPAWLLVAVMLELLSCLGYVATVRLVLNRAPAAEVRRLAWAEMAFGVLVPVGGAGGLAVGAWAMRAWQMSWSRIANRSAVIFLLTSAVNASVLVLAGVGVWLGIGTHRAGILYGLVPALIALGGIAIFVSLPRLGSGRDPDPRMNRLAAVARPMSVWVRDSEAILHERNWRLIGTVGYLLFDIAVLWVCLRAVGAKAPILALAIGYQVGYLANLVPVPGGVGVLDGGLLGALLLYGLPPAQTAAAVVLYHAIAFGIPAIGGTHGFARLCRTVPTPCRSRSVRAVPVVSASGSAAASLAAQGAI